MFGTAQTNTIFPVCGGYPASLRGYLLRLKPSSPLAGVILKEKANVIRYPRVSGGIKIKGV